MNAILFPTAEDASEDLAARGYRNLMGGCWFRLDEQGRWHQAIIECHVGARTEMVLPNGATTHDYEISGYSIDDSIDRGDWSAHWNAHASKEERVY